MSRTIAILIVLSGLLASACTGRSREKALPAKPLTAEQRADSIARALADSALATLSVEEQVGQLFMPATFSAHDEATVHRLSQYVPDTKIGGVVFLRGDTASLHALTSRLTALSPLPLFLAIDAEWGLGMRLKDAPSYPHNSHLSGASEAQLRDLGEQVGADARTLGLNMILGPVLDVASSPASFMADRSFGGDPQKVAALGCAYAHGLMDEGIIPVAKHFPGHGATTTDSHRELPVVACTRAEFEQRDLLPFRRYIDQRFPALMSGHVAVPALTGDTVAASLSPQIMTDVLRRQMDFKGLLLTDAMNMHALPGGEGKYVAALRAGADIILVPEDTRAAHREILQALRQGSLQASDITGRVRRVLYYKYRYIRK